MNKLICVSLVVAVSMGLFACGPTYPVSPGGGYIVGTLYKPNPALPTEFTAPGTMTDHRIGATTPSPRASR